MGSIVTGSVVPTMVTVPRPWLVGYGMHVPSKSHVSPAPHDGEHSSGSFWNSVQSPSVVDSVRTSLGTTPLVTLPARVGKSGVWEI